MKMFFKNLYGKLHYNSEWIFSKSITIQLLLLALVSLIVALIATFFLKITGIMPTEWSKLFLPKVFWKNLMRMMDPGTMGNDDGSWLFLFTMLLTTVMGLIIVSSLISIITEGLETKLKELRKGRSTVYEKNHIVILGWSNKLFVIVDELVNGYYLSHRKRKRICITILADKDKTEMEDLITDYCNYSHKAKIVCRSGNPIILGNLKKLSLQSAQSILILAPEISNSDIFVFKSALAIFEIFQGVKHIYEKVIIAELHDSKLIDLIKKQYLSKERISFLPIDSKKIVSEIVAQSSLQKGLSKIYEELLKFHKTDNEIYFVNASYFRILRKGNLKFKEILNFFKDSCSIGFFDNNKNKIIINPLADLYYSEYVIQPKDQLIFIARNKKMIKIDEHGITNRKNEMKFQQNKELELYKSRTLIFGNNETLPFIVDELGKYVGDGSTITIATKLSDENLNKLKNNISKYSNNNKQKIYYKRIEENIIDKKILETIIGAKVYNNIILLNSPIFSKLEENPNPLEQINIVEKQDAQTIRSLLHIRDFFDKHSDKEGENFSIVTEMGFAYNKDLVPINSMNEFVISDEIISSIFAQTALNKNRGEMFLDILFSDKGSEIYFKNAKYYVNLDKKVYFFMIIQSAIELKEIAIGYVQNGEIYLNPPKDKEITLNKNDQIITLAEEYTFQN